LKARMPVIIGPQSIKDMMAEKIIKKTGCYQIEVLSLRENQGNL